MQYKEFSSNRIPIPEMEEFYQIPKGWVATDRPYVWCMFVMSADGKISFREEGYPRPEIGLSGPGIALAHLKGKDPAAIGSEADWRLLQYGWAVADAVAGGSGIIKAEKSELTWQASDEDIMEYRKNVLGKENPPVQVVLTARGLDNNGLSSPIFNSDYLTTIIATSKRGYDAMRKFNVDSLPVQVKMFGENDVDIGKMLQSLREDYGVKLLDLQGGPTVANQFLHLQLIDELRITKSPFIAGSQNSKGEKRPGLFEGAGFHPDRPVLLEPLGRRYFGHHEFWRDRPDYKLLNK